MSRPDPSTWTPGMVIVDNEGEVFTLTRRSEHRGEPWWWTSQGGITDEYAAEACRPLSDLVRRGWNERQAAGVDYCLTHDGIRNEDEHRCDFAQYDNECDADGEPRPCVRAPLTYEVPS